MLMNDIICNDCNKPSFDRFQDEPCEHCGSANVSVSRNRTQLAISVGYIEPTRMIDHSTGLEVMITSMSEAQRLADNYAKSQGQPPGTYRPYVKDESEDRRWRADQRIRIHEAQIAMGIKPSDF